MDHAPARNNKSTPLTRRDATTLKLALQIVIDAYSILTADEWRQMSAEMPTPEAPIEQTAEAVNRVRIDGQRILRVRLGKTDRGKEVLKVEHVSDMEKAPGGISGVLGALLVLINGLTGNPAGDEKLDAIAHDGDIDPPTLRRLVRSIDIEPAPETIH